MILPAHHKKSILQKKLLHWYSQNKRDLPWRKTSDPYKIWVSEIMLQQTQVKTVIPYYQKWIAVFPTLTSLASAPLSKVLKFWAGLGYYRRARMLHQGAQKVVKEFKGKVPHSLEALRKIPGVGPYTAGAIASIAYGQKVPVLDGNIIRIFTRIFAINQSIDNPKTIQKLWALSASLLPKERIGDFNQALMELGATVCFPKNPQCLNCPIVSVCAAHQKLRELDYPVRLKKKGPEKIQNFTCVFWDKKNRVLIQRQLEQEQWGGLWVFPFWRTEKEMRESFGGSFQKLKLLSVISHAFTKYKIRLYVYTSQKPIKNIPRDSRNTRRWLAVENLARLAFPSPHQKIAAFLREKVLSEKT